jgi:predicted transcriptional regulator
MKTENYQTVPQGTDEQTTLADTLRKWEETCKNCHPLTPLMCMSNCKIWKLKNEFRKLREKMENPHFMTNLLNALKNKRRLLILGVISKGRYSVSKLQQELKESGFYHSRTTIEKEYLTPLIEAGLAEEHQNQYYTTLFGSSLSELIKDFHNIEDVLPPHSECYEEMALSMLLGKPKTYQDYNAIIPAKSIARVLNRLQKTKLIKTSKENDYVFYFKTKRNSKGLKFSPTEKRVYENIPAVGVSARMLCEETRISLRRTYKYLRRLKGKKLVFARKKPKSFSLTSKGLQVALILKEIYNLTVEALATATSTITEEATRELLMPDTLPKSEKKDKKTVPLTTIKMH